MLQTDSTTIAETPLADAEVAWVDRVLAARAFDVLALGTVVGVIGNLLFYYTRPGINILLFTVLVLTSSTWLYRKHGNPIVPKHALFALPMMLSAAFLAVNGSRPLIVANLLTLAATLYVYVRYLGTPALLGGGPAHVVRDFFADGGLAAWFEGPPTIVSSARSLLGERLIPRAQQPTMAAVLRGVMLTVPLVIVFGMLLASADVIFSRLINGLLNILTAFDLGALWNQLMLTTVLAWLCIASLRLLIFGAPKYVPPPHDNRYFGGVAQNVFPPRQPFRLSIIESSMMLGSVNVMFGAFVLIQARYLFGGESNIGVEGFTYAEYARRGFFELVLVSIMTMVLILGLDQFTHRKREHERQFVLMAVTMIGLVMVLLVAAFMRMLLYVDAFGYTQLRVETLVFIVWLPVLFLMLVWQLLSKQRRWFFAGLLIVAHAYILTLNVMNLDRFVATQNINRYHATGKIDISYLASLSDDAIPAITPLLDDDTLSTVDQRTLHYHLGRRLQALDLDRQHRNILGLHLGKQQAWSALDQHRSTLEQELWQSLQRHAP